MIRRLRYDILITPVILVQTYPPIQRSGTPITEYYLFDALTLRYMFYRRSDGLSANIISLLLEIGCNVPRPPRAQSSLSP